MSFNYTKPIYTRLAKGLAAGAIGMAVPFDRIVMGIMLLAQFRTLMMEAENEEAGPSGGDDDRSGGDSVGRLDEKA